eukprot:TRINITY_DN19740_c0_g1_i1.p1 TRINITY_DN19740_c0_g1~~TRINITY_DN19740_c0_g1_i1.p1  ORF type:complete len:247 (-),score=32.61 TRINITY_DN19740_c0_g1_i1:25-765(-)
MRGAFLYSVAILAALWPPTADGTGLRARRASAPAEEPSAVQLEDVAFALAGEENDTPQCSCSFCTGRRQLEDTPTSGYKGFQCTAREDTDNEGDNGTPQCEQTGNSDGWVVQTARIIAYERFCHFTCKPAVPKQLIRSVACVPFTEAEVKRAQSETGNGKSFLWRSNPMSQYLTLKSVKGASSQGSSQAPGAVIDTVVAPMNDAFKSSARRRSFAVPTTPPGCHCRCNASAADTASAVPALPAPII